MATFRLGRTRPALRKKLHFRNYMLAGLPIPPAACDYAPKAAAALGRVYLNDRLGDCVIAGMAHLEGVFSGNAGGPPNIFTDAQIASLYSAIGGYDPSRPDETDNGCDEQTALDYWQRNGVPAGKNRIAAWVALDGTKPLQYRQAMWLFENLLFGVELPDAWIDPFPSGDGFQWAAAGPPVDCNGHCFVGTGYSPAGVKISTWGLSGLITDTAVAAYASTAGSGELYTVITPEIIDRATGRAANGFDFVQLQADFAAL